jgi:hypothetical protein
MSSELESLQIEPALVSIPVGMEYAAISQAEMYRVIGRGHVRAVKRGSRTLLVFKSLKRFVASLPPAKIKAPTRRKRKGA